jgi:SAM-dependent methyltransferase
MSSSTPAHLHRSRYLSFFGHLGSVYLFHDLYGFLMQMSPDIVELIDAFAGGAEAAAINARFATRFEGATPEQFVDVLVAHQVLIELEPDEDERDGMWPMAVVKNKWNVWRREGDRLTIWTAWGDAPVKQIALDADETRMWDAFDGEKRLAELRGGFDPARLRALAERLAHSDVQAIKLSMMPMSTYAKRPQMAPAYLSSTMPYPRWAPGQPVPAAAAGVGEIMSPTRYYQDEVVDAQAQFDHQETTLSHLLRIPHPALRGRTYGQALVDTLAARGQIPVQGSIRVLEIGGGLGYCAAAIAGALVDRGLGVEYRILEVAPALAEAQRARCAGLPVEVVLGDALVAEPGDGAWDLILSNEMVGDLPALQLSRADVGMPLEGIGEPEPAKLAALGRAGELITTLGVQVGDATEPFYVMTGALELMIRISRWLAPGGTAIVTEFGDRGRWPRLSTHLDHPELSTHFAQLEQAARSLGLGSTFEYVIDLIDVDRTQQGLATTRSHFRALRAMAAAAGVDLAKIGYTPALLTATFGDKLALAQVGELRFDKIEDRFMGLVPHEFKAVIVHRAPPPAAGQA